MTSRLQPVKYTKRQQENNLLNTCIQAHDLTCGCPDPLKCLACLIFYKAEPTNFTNEEKQQIRKCLGTIDGGDLGPIEDGIDAGDLDVLFAEDGEKEG